MQNVLSLQKLPLKTKNEDDPGNSCSSSWFVCCAG
ncbi:class III lanthipeptide [Terriglobus sp. RCC_193]